MTASTPAADASEAIAALHAEIERLGSARQSESDLRTTAIVRRAQGSGDAKLAEEITRLGTSIATIDAEIAGAREALSQLQDVAPLLAEREASAKAEAAMHLAKRNAAAVRRLAKAVDDAADTLGESVTALRSGLATLSTEADGAVRAAEGFDMLPYFVGNIPAIVQARLCHLKVMPGQTFVIDRTAPPPSMREQMDRAIYGLLPPQGRPKVSN